MNNEFKIKKYNDATVYTLESASSGGTSSGSVASVSMPMGGTRKRGDNLITQEADKKTVPSSTPRNFVAKNAKTGGAGAHRDKKKEQKQGVEKHKKPYMEDHADAANQGWGAGSYDTYSGGRHGRGVAENPEWYSDEANSMSSSQLKSLYKHAMKLRQAVQQMQAQGDTLEPWQQSKVTKAADYVDAVFNAVDDEHDMGEQQGVEEDDSALQAFLSGGGKIQQLPYKKPRKADKTDYGSKHIGGGGDKMKASRTGTAANTQGSKVAGMAEGQLNEYTPLSGDIGVYMAAAFAAGKVGQAAYDWAKQKWKEHQSKNGATVSEKDMDESLGKWARNAALAGAMALGGAGAHAGSWSPMDVPAGGHNQLPDIVAHVKFKVGDKEINKEINLGAHYRSPGEASEELKNFLNSKGIKFYQYSLERVKPKADDKIDNSPATSDMKGGMDTSEPAASGPSTDNYMAKDNDPENGPSMGGKFVKEDPYFESLQNMLERSVSQAQHNLMVGVAHNPGYAQKVKVKQEVGQEFAQADVGHDISKLPIRVPKKK